MADIKTREVNKGSVKGIDRAKNLSDRLMHAGVRTKDEVYQIGSREDRNETSYATDSSMNIGRQSVRAGGRSVSDAPRQIRRGIDARREAIDIKTKKKMIYRSRRAATDEAVNSPAVRTRRNTTAVQGARAKKMTYSGRVASFKKVQDAKKIENARKTQMATRRAIKESARGARAAARLIVKTIKAAAAAIETLVTAAIAAGSTAVVIILICVLFSASVYLFGNDTKDEFSAEALGVGDTLIMRVASAQLGNVGGLKFCKWYGFSGRVEWCACFVSWCANQCGYIEKGIIPKFALVGDGVDWFKARKRFQNNKYIPHPGDIIFFDWESDGTRDHVGFVERCDGKVVYTIEGNSGDACRRLAYRVGHPEILGYGVPAYPLPQSGQKTTENDAEKNAKNGVNRPSLR